MRKPKAKATKKPVPANPKAETTNVNKPSQALVTSGGEHLAKVAAATAKALGVMLPAGTLWQFDLKADGDIPKVLSLQSDAYTGASIATARYVVTVPLCAYDQSEIVNLDAEINWRVQAGIMQVHFRMFDEDESLTRSDRIAAKANWKVSAGFEPSAEQLKGADIETAKALHMECAIHRRVIAENVHAECGDNPIGKLERPKPDPAAKTVTPTYECDNGCYTNSMVFEGQRLPAIRNVPFTNANTGKFDASALKAVAKSDLVTCQHCGSRCKLRMRKAVGTAAVIEEAKAKYQKLVDRINGVRPVPVTGSPSKIAAANAANKARLMQADHYRSQA